MDAFLLRIKRKDTLLLLIVKRRTTTVFTLRDNSKGAGRSLHYGLTLFNGGQGKEGREDYFSRRLRPL